MIRFMMAATMAATCAQLAHADGWAEFCEWRRRMGLPQVQQDPAMMAFAQNKANYQASRLISGHAGPRTPAGWREGTGNAAASWGWLTCCMEEDARFGGAGMAYGRDGQRYMVLVVRGGSGRALVRRRNLPTFNTSHLTPRRAQATMQAYGGGRMACPNCGKYHLQQAPARIPQQAYQMQGRMPCPNCGGFH